MDRKLLNALPFIASHSDHILLVGDRTQGLELLCADPVVTGRNVYIVTYIIWIAVATVIRIHWS